MRAPAQLNVENVLWRDVATAKTTELDMYVHLDATVAALREDVIRKMEVSDAEQQFVR